jgi:hypothetical protein
VAFEGAIVFAGAIAFVPPIAPVVCFLGLCLCVAVMPLCVGAMALEAGAIGLFGMVLVDMLSARAAVANKAVPSVSMASMRCDFMMILLKSWNLNLDTKASSRRIAVRLPAFFAQRLVAM